MVVDVLNTAGRGLLLMKVWMDTQEFLRIYAALIQAKTVYT